MKRAIALCCATAMFCTVASAQAFKTHTKSHLLDFEYSWPSEVAAVPSLVRHFTKDMREERKTMLADAREANGAKDSLVPFAQYSFYRDITTAGHSRRFLSLKIKTYEFTGGAHGNTYSEAFLWDRQIRKPVPFGMLVDRGAIARLLRSPFCHKLHDERTKRNGQEMSGVFEDCPKLSELKILPADTDHDGKFDVIRLVADQGVAGSNAEGEFDVPVAVTRMIIAAVKPEYRSSFEAQRQ